MYWGSGEIVYPRTISPEPSLLAKSYIIEVSQVVQVRAEGPKAPSPGHRPGYNSNQQDALKGQKLCILPDT